MYKPPPSFQIPVENTNTKGQRRKTNLMFQMQNESSKYSRNLLHIHHITGYECVSHTE